MLVKGGKGDHVNPTVCWKEWGLQSGYKKIKPLNVVAHEASSSKNVEVSIVALYAEAVGVLSKYTSVSIQEREIKLGWARSFLEARPHHHVRWSKVDPERHRRLHRHFSRRRSRAERKSFPCGLEPR